MLHTRSAVRAVRTLRIVNILRAYNEVVKFAKSAEAIMKWVSHAIGLLLVSFLAGCSSYVDGYYYMPRPVIAELPATQPSQPPPVTAFASIVGIRRQDQKAALPESVEVRLRLDNNGPPTTTFDVRSLELTTGDLARFPPPLIQTSGPVVLMPGESALVTAYFPFPGGKSYNDFDLSSLQLRWAIMLGPQRIEQIANFRQEYPRYYYYYDPYWGPYPYYRSGVFVGGVVVIHRR
jgi:hypothetical protein